MLSTTMQLKMLCISNNAFLINNDKKKSEVLQGKIHRLSFEVGYEVGYDVVQTNPKGSLPESLSFFSSIITPSFNEGLNYVHECKEIQECKGCQDIKVEACPFHD